ncbi:hypothetical protein [Acidithiobacillus marinus]|uniref:hypothetical protein n=1 Tax=Acidithiobacillus marinus TaxID=187490 RepID=UPI00117A630F|nr:hypothetical protein [Acidithiobacillus marinus]
MFSRNTQWLLTGILLGFSVQAWAYSGDTIQDDIAREFSGGPTSYTIPLSAPTQSEPTTSPTNNCEATLQQEMGDGQIPTDEQCDCPVGATQPVCTALPASDCPNLLQIEENRLGSDAQYEDCTCPTGASTPQCTSYYQLCKAALPNYQNSTNECTCSQTATSAVPACTSDYSICESRAGSYENSSTTCTCSQTSTEPNCCTTTTVQNCTTTQPSCTTTPNCAVYYNSTVVCGRNPDGLSFGFSGSSSSFSLCGISDTTEEVTGSNCSEFSSDSWYCTLTQTGNCPTKKTCSPPVTTCHPVTTKTCKTE